MFLEAHVPAADGTCAIDIGISLAESADADIISWAEIRHAGQRIVEDCVGGAVSRYPGLGGINRYHGMSGKNVPTPSPAKLHQKGHKRVVVEPEEGRGYH